MDHGLFNMQDYTLTEMVLFVVGCYLWVVAYAVIMRNIWKYGSIEMPTVAGTGNFAWEFVWSWVYMTDMGSVCVIAYRAWFFLDIFIFGALLKYGKKDTELPALKKNFTLYAIVITIIYGVIYVAFKETGYETSIGAVTAFLLNAVISVSYVFDYTKFADTIYYSPWVAWLKAIGTGTNSIFMFLHYPDNHLIHLACVIIAIFDAWYIFLITRDRLRGRAVPQPIR